MCSDVNRILLFITALTFEQINSELQRKAQSSGDMAAEWETEYDSTVKHPTLVSPHIPLLTAACDTLRHNRQEKDCRKQGVCTFSLRFKEMWDNRAINKRNAWQPTCSKCFIPPSLSKCPCVIVVRTLYRKCVVLNTALFFLSQHTVDLFSHSQISTLDLKQGENPASEKLCALLTNRS